MSAVESVTREQRLLRRLRASIGVLMALSILACGVGLWHLWRVRSASAEATVCAATEGELAPADGQTAAGTGETDHVAP